MTVFDATGIDLSAPDTRGLLPNGYYTVVVESLELRNTKSGNGQYFSGAFEVVGGDYAGRKLFTNFI